MEDLNAQILHGFGIRPRRIIKEKSYYICSTDAGYRVIRKSMDTKGHLLFQHSLKEQLFERGFAATDRYYTTDGLPYCEYDENVYVMTNLFRHRESDFSDNADYERIVSQVSVFHSMSKGMRFDQPYYGNDNLLAEYRKQFAEMDGIKKLISQKSRLSDFDVVFLKNYDSYRGQMRESIQTLEKTRLQQAVATAKAGNCICHNLLKEEHILFDGDTTYITGFSQAAVDYPLFDLCAIIQRYAKKLPQPCLGVYDILDIYNRHNPLSHDDIEILRGLLMYPGKFIKLCRQYYSKKRTWTPSAIVNRMETILSGKEVYSRFLESLRH